MKSTLKLIEERHSVREYKQIPIEPKTKEEILTYLDELKTESGLDIRLIDNTDKVFGSILMKFVGWKHLPPAYIAFFGDKTDENAEKCGYFGEKLVLYLQSIGLNTCWVGLFKRSAIVKTSSPAIITIAVGYGESAGRARKSKSCEQVSCYEGAAPDWFVSGVNSALLAPTAMNKQAFMIAGNGNKVKIECNNGAFSFVDLGIVKYHFEQGAGEENFEWDG